MDPDGNIARKKVIKYEHSETRFIEVMESVCGQMTEWRTNYFDPTMPKVRIRSNIMFCSSLTIEFSSYVEIKILLVLMVRRAASS